MSRTLVTGGGGFLGSAVVAGLAGRGEYVVSGDIRLPDAAHRLPGVAYELADVTDGAAVQSVLERHAIDTVVHLAAIVQPGRDTEQLEYRVDVEGSRAVFDACLAAGVRRVVVSSSGAAYGYHADNPEWITEDAPIRGNEEFSYSRHKRLVEEMLAELRQQHPQLEQVVFRIGTILGPGVRNQITALFDAPRLLAVRGSDSPFVFVWVDDVVGCMVRAALDGPAGTYNVAGDGALSVHDLAAIMGKPVVTVPAGVLRFALRVGRMLRLTVHGPERVGFLQYRPVLDNARLKAVFGYTPQRTSRQAFEAFRTSRIQEARSEPS